MFSAPAAACGRCAVWQGSLRGARRLQPSRGFPRPSGCPGWHPGERGFGASAALSEMVGQKCSCWGLAVCQSRRSFFLLNYLIVEMLPLSDAWYPLAEVSGSVKRGCAWAGALSRGCQKILHLPRQVPVALGWQLLSHSHCVLLGPAQPWHVPALQSRGQLCM